MSINQASDDIRAFWAAFCAERGVEGEPFDIDGFGDSPELADHLAGLIVAGEKRATCALARWYESASHGRLPRPGDFSIVLNGAGAPVAVIETVEVRVGPVSSVDAAFAFDEGEGDKSLAWWLEAHRAFFQREAEREGFVYSDALEAVFERFRLVWPANGA